MPAMLPHADATFAPLPMPAPRVHLTTMHQRTPIIEALRSYAASESVSFSTPGHTQGAGLDAQARELLGSRFAGADGAFPTGRWPLVIRGFSAASLTRLLLLTAFLARRTVLPVYAASHERSPCVRVESGCLDPGR